MKHDVFERHLANVRAHAIRGERCARELRDHIQRRNSAGHDTEREQRLLDSFETILALHANGETRLIKELLKLMH